MHITGGFYLTNNNVPKALTFQTLVQKKDSNRWFCSVKPSVITGQGTIAINHSSPFFA